MPRSVPSVDIHQHIFILREHRVILDADLAAIYGVPTKRLNEQVRRNIRRFPHDFMFRCCAGEVAGMRPQNATASKRNVRHLPYAFTEHGAIMAANVLNSPQAIRMSIEVVRAFTRLRRLALSVSELARKVEALEGKYDHQFKTVFDAIRQLMTPPDPPRRRIGFHMDPDKT